MTEVCEKAKDLLQKVFEGAGFDLRVTSMSREDGCLLDIKGEDTGFLRSDGGELLDALELLLNQSFTRELDKNSRITCDVESFRATREAELRAMANHAADRVRTTQTPFTFGPMNPQERRVIHLALAEDELLQTESIGEGHERRLKISLKNRAV